MLTRLEARFVGAFFLLAMVCAPVPLNAAAQNGSAAPTTTPIGQISIDDGAPSLIYAFSFGAEQLVGDAGGGGAVGKAVLDDISIAKVADALSTSLLEYLVTGRHLLNVRVELFGSNAKQVASTFELEDVIVTRFDSSGQGAETVAFKYRIVQLTSGGATICWDTVTNQTC